MKLKLNWMLLTTLVMMSLSSFSQNVTDTTKTIQLTTPIAKLVAKDLTRLDGVVLENINLNELIESINSKVLSLNELVFNQQKQIENLNLISSNKDKQLTAFQELSDQLQSSLKKAQKQKKLYQIGSVIGAVVLLLNIIGT